MGRHLSDADIVRQRAKYEVMKEQRQVSRKKAASSVPKKKYIPNPLEVTFLLSC